MTIFIVTLILSMRRVIYNLMMSVVSHCYTTKHARPILFLILPMIQIYFGIRIQILDS